ncbi:MAG: hypothetical protein EBU90_27690, partial [Proteobacteria bacterium]|nr:hypothetical protein [Pseudomonadota bacterium]
DLKIHNIILDYDDESRKLVKNMTYQEEMDFLVSHNKRNVFIRNLAITQKNNTLVLFQFVEKHGKLLYDMIESKCQDRQVFFVFGGTDTEQREQIRQLTEKEKERIEIWFGEDVLMLDPNETVYLLNGESKLAKDITTDDDISDTWVKSKIL